MVMHYKSESASQHLTLQHILTHPLGMHTDGHEGRREKGRHTTPPITILPYIQTLSLLSLEYSNPLLILTHHINGGPNPPIPGTRHAWESGKVRGYIMHHNAIMS